MVSSMRIFSIPNGHWIFYWIYVYNLAKAVFKLMLLLQICFVSTIIIIYHNLPILCKLQRCRWWKFSIENIWELSNVPCNHESSLFSVFFYSHAQALIVQQGYKVMIMSFFTSPLKRFRNRRRASLTESITFLLLQKDCEVGFNCPIIRIISNFQIYFYVVTHFVSLKTIFLGGIH